MPPADKRTISLPRELAAYVDGLVATGAYASASEVMRAGLRALQEREGAMNSWLRDEVVPVAATMQVDPSRAIAAEDVFDALRAAGSAHGS